MSWETAAPLAIIVGAVGLMGLSQGWIHKAFYGKPKAIGQDPWDRAMNQRDDRLKKEQELLKAYRSRAAQN